MSDEQILNQADEGVTDDSAADSGDAGKKEDGEGEGSDSETV